jgi:hypothetical protein
LSIIYTISRLPWMEDKPMARCLPMHMNKWTHSCKLDLNP